METALRFFEQQCHQLSQLLMQQQQDDFREYLEQLEFQYYTQPVEFNQLIQLVFDLLSEPVTTNSANTFDLYVFLSDNFVSLSLTQQQQLLSLIKLNYPNYQQADVLRVLHEIIGEKFANKAAWHVIQHLKDATSGQQRAQIPVMLARLIQHSSSTAIKRQAVLMLQALTQDDERPTRQTAQQTLQRSMRLMNPRVWRSLGLNA